MKSWTRETGIDGRLVGSDNSIGQCWQDIRNKVFLPFDNIPFCVFTGKHRRETYACEGQTLKISCGESSDGQHQRIRVLRANYGRFSIALCNPNGVVGWSTKCMSATSTQVLIERLVGWDGLVLYDVVWCDLCLICLSLGICRCAEKASCSVDVADKTFGDDPCRGTDKYLEVHYECTSGKPLSFFLRPH